MDRCALFVDAGYVLTDGAMAVHGTRRRESVSWDYAGLLQLFGNLAMERTRLPLLRCYWYEATVEGRRSADHDTLADLPGVKLRVAKMRPGRREGVEGEIHRDLTTLARNKAVSDVMVVSAEEDLAQVIADVQDMGMRVTLLHIATDGNWTISRALRQECDDIAEISAAHLRPYVELISGAEPPRPDESDSGSLAPRPAMNGSVNGNGLNGNGNGTGDGTRRRVRAAAGQAGDRTAAAGSARPAGLAGAWRRTSRAGTRRSRSRWMPRREIPGQPERVDAPVADFGAGLRDVDYSASVDYGAAADYAPAVDHAPSADQAAAVDYGSALDYGPTVDYGPVPDYAAAAPKPAPVPPREDIYAAPVALPTPTDDIPGDRERDRTAARPRAGRRPCRVQPRCRPGAVPARGHAPGGTCGRQRRPAPSGARRASRQRLGPGPAAAHPWPGARRAESGPAGAWPAAGPGGGRPRPAARRSPAWWPADERSADRRPAGRARRAGGAHGLSGRSRCLPSAVRAT